MGQIKNIKLHIVTDIKGKISFHWYSTMSSSNPAPVNKTIVWEFQSDIPGMFSPFSDKVSNYLEQCYILNSKVNLQQIDPSMKEYSIDIGRMIQINNITSSQRQIRRSLYDCNSSLGTGIAWEWMTDRGWITYDVDTLSALETAFSRNDRELDLSSLKYNLPNLVLIDKGYQKNKNTGYFRPVQRKAVAYRTTGTSITGVTNQNSTRNKMHANHSAPVKPPYPGASVSSLSGTASTDGASTSNVPKITNNVAIMKFCNFVAQVEDDDAECAICLIPFRDLDNEGDGYDSAPIDNTPVVELNKCKHCYHQSCIEALYKQGQTNGCLQCPICKTIHGIKTGIQPVGTMNVTFDPNSSVSGYQGDGMITITYDIHSGTQGPNDPNPGATYNAYGFPRTAFLPANSKGKKVLKLLKLAWERRLIFTIGTSTTTGRDNAVVWNEIHHKTSPTDNGSGHGFPDPMYLDNVIEELKQHGVVEDTST